MVFEEKIPMRMLASDRSYPISVSFDELVLRLLATKFFRVVQVSISLLHYLNLFIERTSLPLDHKTIWRNDD